MSVEALHYPSGNQGCSFFWHCDCGVVNEIRFLDKKTICMCGQRWKVQVRAKKLKSKVKTTYKYNCNNCKKNVWSQKKMSGLVQCLNCAIGNWGPS